ncbi:flagellar basal-body rod protein FlgC [Alkalithermobacter thermoalcaliphilus JW-YL-7 = DSM 7308]|uniref:Flagellar basal-body rod protein FlgC n=1 Tax=Alkalithermobacter thermoalcaliphilus JW-YL-7 = DSM 7308 TaxID=1121328 RepID=A0A150FQ81_CLOPD|nr:flagellar basal-body rod protein FlgC [[Clostridium] paradoxum JW-YL-7 = DSM 7308]SHK61631.1 flagellar basal-body rod protein FlgC [[Clostridium] paradoxum JW-YL-7 = DSM 7308]
MSLFRAINISASALTAERFRMDIISKNIANVNTTKTANGTPYRRQVVVLKESEKNSFKSHLNKALNVSGVEVSSVKDDNSPYKRIYDPGHPDADKEGYVLMPNVDIVTEMVNMISSTRAYEANVTALNSTKSMMMKALEIGK